MERLSVQVRCLKSALMVGTAFVFYVSKSLVHLDSYSSRWEDAGRPMIYSRSRNPSLLITPSLTELHCDPELRGWRPHLATNTDVHAQATRMLRTVSI